jgi:hypothetical protein
MESAKVAEIFIKLLDHPAQLMIALSVGLSYYLLKQNKELLKNTIETFAYQRLEVEKVKNEFHKLSTDLILFRGDIGNAIESIRPELTRISGEMCRLSDRIDSNGELFTSGFKDLEVLKKELTEHYGKIIYIDDKIKQHESKIEFSHRSLGNIALILEKHKSYLDKIK